MSTRLDGVDLRFVCDVTAKDAVELRFHLRLQRAQTWKRVSRESFVDRATSDGIILESKGALPIHGDNYIDVKED